MNNLLKTVGEIYANICTKIIIIMMVKTIRANNTPTILAPIANMIKVSSIRLWESPIKDNESTISLSVSFPDFASLMINAPP